MRTFKDQIQNIKIIHIGVEGGGVPGGPYVEPRVTKFSGQ